MPRAVRHFEDRGWRTVEWPMISLSPRSGLNRELGELEGRFDAVVLAVAHNQFKTLNVRSFLANEKGVVYDVKGILDKGMIDGRL